MFGLILPVLLTGTGSHADDGPKGRQSLEQTLREGGKSPARFRMDDGQSIIGRFIRLKEDVITVRRPSGGLRSLPLANIETIDIANSDGKLVRGWLTALDDGSAGWTTDDPSSPEHHQVAVIESTPPSPETGGPLIKIPASTATAIPPLDLEGAGNAEISRDDDAVEGQELAAIAPSADDGTGAGSKETLQLDVRADDASEAENVMYFRLSLSAPSEQPLVIIYSILNGSAMADSDYKHRQGVMVFAPGEQQKKLAVEVIDDDQAEDIETFKLFVTADPNAVAIANRTVEARILDNDS